MKLSDELRGLANRLSAERRTNHPENSRIYAMVAKAVTLENDNAALRGEVRGALEVIGSLCQANGGEVRVRPVLFRGDDEIVAWDDPLTLERVYRLASPRHASKPEVTP